MSMRMVGQHPVTETILGVAIAALTVFSIGIGFIVGVGDVGRYLRAKPSAGDRRIISVAFRSAKDAAFAERKAESDSN